MESGSTPQIDIATISAKGIDNMPWKSNYSHPKGWRFEITQDTKAGYYLWIYKINETMDHLQDTLEIAKEQAYEDFGVPLDSWVEE